jgi:hypothetical protein
VTTCAQRTDIRYDIQETSTVRRKRHVKVKGLWSLGQGPEKEKKKEEAPSKAYNYKLNNQQPVLCLPFVCP